ncbi:hypothetical protein GPY51_23985 [Photorhabdus laumondii subsp. laumondii]|nr:MULTISPECIES: hypothetical protein [Photorhabdus]AWK41219.1 hypothetical protein A4R40_06720 [Photorhabdus laumondii subsp. laumondii]AXG41952.1 hypothetical protein PluDJC_06495 [Photorhabdus laumondii subsp. laumondii]AXG46543.1 hypothetical protein PluTT01m_06915 [Photorhabdus laumondii subsp. laumondii]MCC8386445.1 hypothetical protein [Photorhabdus laumondii]MCC8390703.1 hypothetical protein [Photorhabdus laumondii]
MKCIKCENPTLHESDFCAACEEKELSRIGGFLYFPAINIIFAILSSLFSAYKAMTILISGYDFLGELRVLIGFEFIPVIFQAASLLAALTHPGHIVIYAPGDSFPCRRDAT